MSEGQEQGVSKKKGKGGLIAVICVGVVIIAVLAGVIVYLLHKNNDENNAESDPGRGVVVNEDNVEEVLNQLETPTPPGMYEVVMNSMWSFPSGSEASSDAYVENSTRNSQSVYFDVTLQDTGETVFESPILTVGSHLDSEDIKLDKDLEAGTYDGLVTYHLLDDEGNSVSTVKLTLTIRVLK